MSNIDEDYIPPNALEVFIKKLPSNSDMPLARGENSANHRNVQLGDVENLPQAVQSIVTTIRNADSIGEKAAIAHSFSQAYIKDELQFGGSLGKERKVSFEELAKDPRGDCDDHMQFMSGLLVYGGVNPRDIFMLGGMVNYQGNEINLKTGHAFVVVRSGDEYILLDNNLTDTPLIDPENPIVNSKFCDDEGGELTINGETQQIKAEVLYLSGAVDRRGTSYENKESLAKTGLYMKGFLDGLVEKINKLNEKINEQKIDMQAPNLNSPSLAL